MPALLVVLALSGCATMQHTVGNGGTGKTVVTARQWYLIFGLGRVEPVDSAKLANGAKDYTIRTRTTFADFLYGFLLAPFTIRAQTVEVSR